MKKYIFLVWLLCLSSAVVAEQITVNFKAKVYESMSPHVAVDDVIDVQLVYNGAPEMPSSFVQDTTPGSKIEVTFANGDRAYTSYDAYYYLNIHNSTYDFGNGIFRRSNSYVSHDLEFTSSYAVDDIDVLLEDLFYEAPPNFKTTWSPDLNRYETAEIRLGVEGQFVFSEIIEITSDAPITPPLPELFTVSYTAEVIDSQSSLIAVGEQLTGTIAYDAEFANQPEVVFDSNKPGSGLTLETASGLKFKTRPSSYEFLNISSYTYDYGNGVYNQYTDFSSSEMELESDTYPSLHRLSIYIEELFYSPPLDIKTEWSLPVSEYRVFDLWFELNNEEVLAKVTSVTTNRVITPPPPPLPELFKISYEAKVTESGNPNVPIDSIITGEVEFNLDAMPNESAYYEMTPRSQMTANLPDGSSFVTAISSNPFLEFDSYIYEMHNGNFERRFSVRGHDLESLIDPQSHSHLSLDFTELFATLPSYKKTNWSKPLSEYLSADLYGYFDGFHIGARITSISTIEGNPPPPPTPAISLNSSSDINSVPASGGSMVLTHTITNLVDLTFAIEHWQYIQMPDGTVFPVSLMQSQSLTPLSQQTFSHTFTVPAHWPSGQYSYFIGGIIPDTGNTQNASVIFIKE